MLFHCIVVGEASDEGGVSGGDGDAGMVDNGDPRQGADLKKQIGLFVEMSTPFFKVNHRQYILVGRVAGRDNKPLPTPIPNINI